MLKQYEKCCIENVQIIIPIEGGRNILSNKSVMQNSNSPGQMINNVPNNPEQTGNIKQAATNRNIDKPDESINI